MTIESDATKGSASEPLSKRLESLVKYQSEHKDPPVVTRTTIVSMTNTLPVRDGDTSVSKAIQLACERGDILAFTKHNTEYLALPVPEAFRFALGDPDRDTIREVIERETERDNPRKAYIGALNQL